MSTIGAPATTGAAAAAIGAPTGGTIGGTPTGGTIGGTPSGGTIGGTPTGGTIGGTPTGTTGTGPGNASGTPDMSESGAAHGAAAVAPTVPADDEMHS